MARSSVTQEKEAKAFFVISGLYGSAFLVMTLTTGHLSYFGDASLFFGSNDAQGYKLLADYYTSFGHSERPSDFLLAIRPFMFPLFLGLYRLIGVAGVQLLHLMMNAASLWLVFHSLNSLSNRRWIAGGGAAFLALTPSFNFLALHAMTETLFMFLVSLFVAFTVDHFRHERPTSLFIAAFVLSLMLCTKPVTLPFWLVFVAYFFIYWLRSNHRQIWQPLTILAPVVCQLVVSVILAGPAVNSSIGSSALSTWFFPAVYGQQEYGKFVGRKSPEAQEGLKHYPEPKDKLLYIIEHYPTAMRTYVSLLVGSSLASASNWIYLGLPAEDKNKPALRFLHTWSIMLNRLFTCVHAVMLGVIIFSIVRGSRGASEQTILVCYAFAVSLIVPTGLAYWQGDRLVVISAPLWLVSYGALAARFGDHWVGLWVSHREKARIMVKR